MGHGKDFHFFFPLIFIYLSIWLFRVLVETSRSCCSCVMTLALSILSEMGNHRPGRLELGVTWPDVHFEEDHDVAVLGE